MRFKNGLLFTLLPCICAGCSMAGTKADQEPLVTSSGAAFEAPEFYPAFSWEKVPIYMMFAHGQRLLHDSEVEKIAGETDFICIEKNHGLHPLGDAVLGLKHENKAIKDKNPAIKVLGYLNSALTYTFTRYTEMFTPDLIGQHPDRKAFLITDRETGELATHVAGRYCLNVLNPEMRAWWSDAGADMVRVSGADGIFIDQMHGCSWMHPKDQRQAVADAVADMMAQLKAKMGPDKMFIANNGAHIPAVFEIADGFMFEHYKREVTHTKEKLLQDWEMMEKIADAGKICIYRFGPEPGPDSPQITFPGGKALKGTKRDAYAALAKEQLEFFLALYLIGAQPYSYFQWNWAWDLRGGPLEHYPEFHKPLGTPLGKYKRVHPDQWEFTREFEHASVWVDTEKREAKLSWKP